MNKFVHIGLVFLFIFVVMGSATFAADSTGEYLKVQEPQYASPSGLSVFAYVLSLLFTFGVVVALAYFASKFWGSKFSRFTKKNNNNKIYLSLALGPNRAVYVVEIVGEYFVLGVTEHNITLLHQITAPEQIRELKAQSVPSQSEDFDLIFRNQLDSLKHMSQKFPGVFGMGRQTDSESAPFQNQSSNGEKR